MPICAKQFLPRQGKFQVLVKHTCPLGPLQGAVVFRALLAGTSLVTIPQASDSVRVSTPARHYFSTYNTITDEHWDSTQHVFLHLFE